MAVSIIMVILRFFISNSGKVVDERSLIARIEILSIGQIRFRLNMISPLKSHEKNGQLDGGGGSYLLQKSIILLLTGEFRMPRRFLF